MVKPLIGGLRLGQEENYPFTRKQSATVMLNAVKKNKNNKPPGMTKAPS